VCVCVRVCVCVCLGRQGTVQFLMLNLSLSLTLSLHFLSQCRFLAILFLSKGSHLGQGFGCTRAPDDGGTNVRRQRAIAVPRFSRLAGSLR
jgi:hypothetical protein